MKFRSAILEELPPKPVDAIPYVGLITYGVRSLRSFPALTKKIMSDELDLGGGQFPQTRELAKYYAFLLTMLGFNHLVHRGIIEGLRYFAER